MKYALLTLATLTALWGCDSDPAGPPDRLTITQAVAADAQLATLEAAVVEAELDDDLAGAGPFTVFAPTDAAFQALLAALGTTPEALLAREDLGDVLTLHVVSGAVAAGDLAAGQTVATLNGETLTVVATADGGFGLDTDDDGDEADARIVATDLRASNGIVHKIDAVLLP